KFGLLLGGVSGDGSRHFLNDTWLWRDGEWSRATAPHLNTTMTPEELPSSGGAGPVPAARAGHSIVFNGTYFVLFGGEGDSGLLNDTWLWQGSWTPVVQPDFSAQRVPPRTGQAM